MNAAQLLHCAERVVQARAARIAAHAAHMAVFEADEDTYDRRIDFLRAQVQRARDDEWAAMWNYFGALEYALGRDPYREPETYIAELLQATLESVERRAS